MKEQEIIRAIERIVQKNYKAWRIGITDDPESRKKHHGNPRYWHDWRADTEAMARRVEKHFINKGMKGGVGGGESPNYVYIFR